jgi:tRNAThr (cytosine32-N3)-methyltransferase
MPNVPFLQMNPLYLSPTTGIMHASVWDVTSPDTLPVEPGSVDIIILVFVMSALHPDEWGRAIANIHKVHLIYLRFVHDQTMTV